MSARLLSRLLSCCCCCGMLLGLAVLGADTRAAVPSVAFRSAAVCSAGCFLCSLPCWGMQRCCLPPLHPWPAHTLILTPFLLSGLHHPPAATWASP